MELLTELARWSRVAFAGGVQLRGPLGRVTIREAVAPIPRLAALAGGAVTDVTRAVTLEGEHAVLARCGARRSLALVIGDRDATVLDGETLVDADGDALHAFVGALARHAYLGLGAVRRRRYVYTPPPGWRGVAQPHGARWLHPAFPRTPHAITVADARPRAATGPSVIDREVVTDATRGMLKDAPRPLARVAARGGLTGVVAVITGRHRDTGPADAIVRATLVDARFEYGVELHAPAASVDASIAALGALIETLEPVPEPALDDVSARVLFWGDEPL